jgi:hypothetical protein
MPDTTEPNNTPQPPDPNLPPVQPSDQQPADNSENKVPDDTIDWIGGALSEVEDMLQSVQKAVEDRARNLDTDAPGHPPVSIVDEPGKLLDNPDMPQATTSTLIEDLLRASTEDGLGRAAAMLSGPQQDDQTALVLRGRTEDNRIVHHHLATDPALGQPVGRLGWDLRDNPPSSAMHLELWGEEHRPDLQAEPVHQWCRSVGELVTVLAREGYYLAGENLGDLVDETSTRTPDTASCRCVESCADDPDTACSLSGHPHVHPDNGSDTFGPCPVHPDAPGDL